MSASRGCHVHLVYKDDDADVDDIDAYLHLADEDYDLPTYDGAGQSLHGEAVP